MKWATVVVVFLCAKCYGIQYRINLILSGDEPHKLVHNGLLVGRHQASLHPATMLLGATVREFPLPQNSQIGDISVGTATYLAGSAIGDQSHVADNYPFVLNPLTEQYTFLPPKSDYASEYYDVRDMNSSDEIVGIITNEVTGGNSANRWKRDASQPSGWRRDSLIGTGGQTEVFGISEDGTMFGRSNIDGIVWHPDLTRVVLSRPSTANARAYGRDRAGHIYGMIAESAGSLGTSYSFAKWDSEYSSATTIHSFTGLGPIINSGSNAVGQSVGFGNFLLPDNSYRMFGWFEDPQMGLVDLNDLLVDAPGVHIYSALSIDDAGNITAQSTLGYVYLQPVPEPGSLAVLALGAVGLLKKRRKA